MLLLNQFATQQIESLLWESWSSSLHNASNNSEPNGIFFGIPVILRIRKCTISSIIYFYIVFVDMGLPGLPGINLPIMSRSEH